MSDLCCNRLPLPFSRREMLRLAACGFGSVAFSAMAAHAGAFPLFSGDDDEGAVSPLAPKKPHFAPRAKRIIFLCMAGAPSHVDTFDHKPELTLSDGSTYRGNSKLLASPWKFRQSGQSGLWISDLFPNLQKKADDLCLLRGMKAEIPAHAQASIQLHTGSFQFVRPSMGASSQAPARWTRASSPAKACPSRKAPAIASPAAPSTGRASCGWRPRRWARRARCLASSRLWSPPSPTKRRCRSWWTGCRKSLCRLCWRLRC